MVHVSQTDLLRHVESGLPESERAEVGTHLLECGTCRLERDLLSEVIDGLRAPDPGTKEIDLMSRINRAMLRPPRPSFLSRHPRAIAAVEGALAALMAISLFLPIVARQDEFRSKSTDAKNSASRWTGVQAFIARDSGDVVKLGPRLGQDNLMFTYSNVSKEPYSHLMIFGVDSASEVRWYYPAYSDPSSDPAAISIARETSIPLPDRIEHDIPRGRYIIYGLFLRRPLTVSEVEARVRELARQGVFSHTAKEAPALQIAEDHSEQALITEVE